MRRMKASYTRLCVTGNQNDHVTLKTCILQCKLVVQDTNQITTRVTIVAFLCLDPSYSHR